MAVKKENVIWVLITVLLVLAFLSVDTPARRLVVDFGRGIWGLIEEARPTPTIQTDVPTRTQDEACAMVYAYLETRGNAMTIFVKRLELLHFLDKALPYFTASYQGNGKWQVWAVGNDGVGATGNLSGGWDGCWYVYEKSGAIEPANDKARELLSYIQWCTR